MLYAPRAHHDPRTLGLVCGAVRGGQGDRADTRLPHRDGNHNDNVMNLREGGEGGRLSIATAAAARGGLPYRAPPPIIPCTCLTVGWLSSGGPGPCSSTRARGLPILRAGNLRSCLVVAQAGHGGEHEVPPVPLHLLRPVRAWPRVDIIIMMRVEYIMMSQEGWPEKCSMRACARA